MFKHLSKFSDFILENNTTDILKNVMSIENIAKKHNIDIKNLEKYLEIGTKIEREHTDDNEIAKKITLKHLEENPMYYHQKFGLPEIEKRFKKIEQDKILIQDIINQQKIDQDIIETNESIKDFLKPKSEDEILKELNKLSDIEKFEKSCQYGIISIIKNMIDNGFDPSYYNNYGITIASRNGHLDIVKLLLKDKRVDPSSVNNHSIRNASYNGHVEVVKELLKDERVDPSDSYNYAIRYSTENGHVEVVKELLKDERVDPSVGNNYAIRYSSENGHVEVVKELLKDKRVTDKLSKERLDYYKNQIKK